MRLSFFTVNFLTWLLLLFFILSCTRDRVPAGGSSTEPPKPADVEWIKTNGPNNGPVWVLAADERGEGINRISSLIMDRIVTKV